MEEERKGRDPSTQIISRNFLFFQEPFFQFSSYQKRNVQVSKSIKISMQRNVARNSALFTIFKMTSWSIRANLSKNVNPCSISNALRNSFTLKPPFPQDQNQRLKYQLETKLAKNPQELNRAYQEPGYANLTSSETKVDERLGVIERKFCRA